MRSALLRFLLAAMVLATLPSCAGPGRGGAAIAAADAPATPAPEADEGECVRGRPEPILASTAASPQTLQRLGPYEASEHAELDGKVGLDLRQFGCAHYTVEYAFSLPAEPKAPAPRAGLELAAKLLDQLPVVPAQARATRSLAAFLRGRAGESYTYGDSLQMSEMETVSVRAEASPPGTKLVVLYDVAL